MKKRPLLLLAALMLASTILALFLGRFSFSPAEFFSIVNGWLSGDQLSPLQEQTLLIMVNVRLPRIIAALSIGASLAVSGTVYQAMFLNPLVSPGILGVLAGASCGAGIGIVFFPASWLATQVLAFVFACLAVGMSLFFAAFMRKSSLLVLILGGMISTSFFTSLTSMLKFLADPNKQLPELIYWLMGTFSRIEGFTLVILGIPMLLGIFFLILHGKIINALSMGDEEALSLGVQVRPMRLRIIAAATFISALSVVLVGVVGWIGLIIPHIMRFLVGTDNRLLLPAAAMGGATFLMLTDLLTRNLFTAELPIGVYTALISLPLFAVSLRYSKGSWK